MKDVLVWITASTTVTAGILYFAGWTYLYFFLNYFDVSVFEVQISLYDSLIFAFVPINHLLDKAAEPVFQVGLRDVAIAMSYAYVVFAMAIARFDNVRWLAKSVKSIALPIAKSPVTGIAGLIVLLLAVYGSAREAGFEQAEATRLGRHAIYVLFTPEAQTRLKKCVAAQKKTLDPQMVCLAAREAELGRVFKVFETTSTIYAFYQETEAGKPRSTGYLIRIPRTDIALVASEIK